MAQRTEKEETEFKVVPETLTLCVNNCGVRGNPATNNMCQKCFNATTSSTASSSSSTSSVSVVTAASASSIKFPRSSLAGSSSMGRSSDLAQPSTDRLVTATAAVEVKGTEAEAAVTTKRVVTRCSGCPRKVGLSGFRCRCGDLFCWEHRYSDRHDCSYDYKAAGRDVIARENPVIKAAKIVRI